MSPRDFDSISTLVFPVEARSGNKGRAYGHQQVPRLLFRPYYSNVAEDNDGHVLGIIDHATLCEAIVPGVRMVAIFRCDCDEYGEEQPVSAFWIYEHQGVRAFFVPSIPVPTLPSTTSNVSCLAWMQKVSAS